MKERDEKMFAEEAKYVSVWDDNHFLYLSIDWIRNQLLMRESTVLKQRIESADKKLNDLKRVNEVSNQWDSFHFIDDLLLQTIHDEFQALQLICTQLELRNQELEAINIALRQEMTAKFEGVYDKLDKEVSDHEKFVCLGKKIFFKWWYFFSRQKADAVVQRLNDATRDITTTSRTSLE